MHSPDNTVEANSEELMNFEINNTGADSSSTQLDRFEANNSPTDDLEVSSTCNFTKYCAKWKQVKVGDLPE